MSLMVQHFIQKDGLTKLAPKSEKVAANLDGLKEMAKLGLIVIGRND